MYQPQKPYKKKIIALIKKTWNTPYAKIIFNTYPIIKKKLNLPEVDHTDGIGTKGVYHWQKGTFKEAVIDALAMNLNDLALVRAVPYKLSNHITVPVEDERILKILEALATECKKRKIAITGGENSFHDNMNGMEISITMTGFIQGKVKPNKFKTGDILIGLKSSGLHSNGTTTVRRIFKKEIRPEFTVPTKIYLDDILALNKKVDIHGMMHITGGAFTKLKDIMSSNQDINIKRNHKLKPHKIFYELYKRGLTDKEMYTAFNCGVGFILSVGKQDASKVLKQITGSDIIGEVKKGNGKVVIESLFSTTNIEL